MDVTISKINYCGYGKEIVFLMFAALMNVLSGRMLQPLVTISLKNPTRLKKTMRNKDSISSLNKQVDVFQSGNDVGGVVSIRCGQRELRHEGIFIELVGSVKGTEGISLDFMKTRQQLKSPSSSPISNNDEGLIEIPFVFEAVSFEYASYEGISASIFYSLQVSISNRVVSEQIIWIADKQGDEQREFEKQLAQWSCTSKPLDAGVPSFLHIRMQLDQNVIDRDTVLFGRLKFLLVRVCIVDVSLFFVRKEEELHSPFGEQNDQVEDEDMQFGNGSVLSQKILMKRQICEGAVCKGDDLQFTLDFGQCFPTDQESSWLISHMNMAQTFAVKHYIGVVLRDDQGRRYFKQQQVLVRPCTINIDSSWSISLASSL